MPQRTNALQRLVTLLHGSLADCAIVRESALLEDTVTHEQREVDVLVTVNAASYEVRLGIEVVDRSRPMGTPWIESMRAKCANLPIDKLILVSGSGFTRPAQTKAKFYGIETLTIERAIETDWPLLATLESQGVFELVTLRFDCSAVCIADDRTLYRVPAPLQAPLQVGQRFLSVGDFARQLIALPQFKETLFQHVGWSGQQDFWMSYSDPSGIWLIEKGEVVAQIAEMRIGLKVTSLQSTVALASGAYRGRPFMVGTSAPDSQSLQFVLVKHPDGAKRGVLIQDSSPIGLYLLATDQA